MDPNVCTITVHLDFHIVRSLCMCTLLQNIKEKRCLWDLNSYYQISGSRNQQLVWFCKWFGPQVDWHLGSIWRRIEGICVCVLMIFQKKKKVAFILRDAFILFSFSMCPPVTFIPWWNPSLLMGVVSSRMTSPSSLPHPRRQGMKAH